MLLKVINHAVLSNNRDISPPKWVWTDAFRGKSEKMWQAGGKRNSQGSFEQNTCWCPCLWYRVLQPWWRVQSCLRGINGDWGKTSLCWESLGLRKTKVAGPSKSSFIFWMPFVIILGLWPDCKISHMSCAVVYRLQRLSAPEFTHRSKTFSDKSLQCVGLFM